MILHRLLARCQQAVWAHEEWLRDPEAMAATPWRTLVVESFLVLAAGLSGFGPLYRDPSASEAFLKWVRNA